MADDKISMIFDFLVGKNEVEKTLANTKKEAEKTQKSFFNLNNAIKFSAITAGFFAVKNILTKLTDAAVVQEKAVKNLNIAMALTGQYSQQASRDMQLFASSLQDASMFGDEVILGQLSIAKALGQTNDQAKKTVQAAVDLSSALGISLDSAVKNLSKSFSGQLGELGELIPETRNLSKEALRSGEAVDLVAKKFKDFAKTQMGDFEGATNRASKSFGDLLETFGLMITQNDLVIGFFNGVADAINNAIPKINEFASAINETAKGTGENLSDWAGFIQGEFFNALDKINPAVIEANTKLGLLGFTFDGVTQEAKDATPAISEFGKKLNEINQKAETPAEKLKTKIKEIGAALRESFNKEDLDSIAGPNSSFVQNLVKSGASIEEVKTKIKEAIDGQKELDKNLAESAKAREEERKKTLQDRLSFAGSAISGVGAGAAGAGQVIGAGAGLAAETFLGEGAGKIVGPLVQLLGKSSEELRQNIRSFVDGAAEFILNIIENIPVLITELINAWPRFLDAVLRGIPRVINGIISQLPHLVRAMIMQIPNLIKSVVSNFPYLVKTLISELTGGLISSMPEIFKSFGASIFESFFKLFSDFNPINLLSKIFKFDGGGEGPVEKFLGFDFPFLKFAKGGLIGGKSGGPDSEANDIVPALLSKGEVVLPKSVVNGGAKDVISFMQKLGLGPNKFGFGSFISDAFDSVADVAQTFTDALGNVIEGVSSGEVNKIKEGLKGATFDTLSSLTDLGINFLPEPLRSILKSLKSLGAELSARELIANPVKAITSAVRSLVETTLKEPLKKVLVSPAKMNLGGVVQGIGNRDSVPAMLTPGERVLTVEQNNIFEAMLSEMKKNGVSSKSGQPIQINLQIGTRELASVLVDINRNNLRVA